MKSTRIILPVLVFVAFVLMNFASLPCAEAAQKCDEWVAKVVSVQGKVEARSVGEAKWVDVQLNDTYCPEDVVRVSDESRAAVLLKNDVILRLDRNTTVSFMGPDRDETFLLKLISGAAHFFSRSPRPVKVITPFINASVGGTEFFIKVEQGQASVSVFEGQVSAVNEAGSVSLTKGQSAVAQAGKAPELKLVVRPRDAVQWALYYPPIIDYRPADFSGGRETGWQARVRTSIEHYLDNDLTGAFESLKGITGEIGDPRFFTYRAGLNLTVGHVEEATLDVERALDLDPRDSHAFALQAIIAVVQNRKDKGMELAKRAVELGPQSSDARVALSYAQQAHFDLKGALSSINEAVRLSPDNALALARLAELRLSVGELHKALDAARGAVNLNPKLARTQTVLGFAYLTQIKTGESKKAFEKAIELDQADPLPRLGLGLAKIRDGDLKAGRKEIEIAVILDPNNSLIRSYLGKAYFEEKRDKRSKEQLDMAKDLDPLDPTPYFYDAIRKQTVNRPVEALEDLQKSMELNDNRAVYRSRLQLDQDLAARSASLAQIYRNLGFEQAALVEACKSFDFDPSNFSAHAFLANAYAGLPRHQIARVSELLQTQMLQPININPVQPELAESKLNILSGAGPADPAFNEYNALFNRNRLAFAASGIAGERGVLGDEVVQSGLWNKFSYSLGQFHYQTDGFRTNNDLRKDIYNAFVQVSLTPQTSVQAEYRNRDISNGDLNLLFDPTSFFRHRRQDESTESIRFGLRQSFSPTSDVLASFAYRTLDFKSSNIVPVFSTDETGYDVQAQYLFHSDRFNIISGVGHFSGDFKDRDFGDGFTLITRPDTDQTNFYVYSQLHYPQKVTWTLGGSVDFFEGTFLKLDRQQFNPKVGVTWEPFPGTTLRAAAFRTLKRTLISEQTLEPTQVAGFNQFFDDASGSDIWRYGIGIDQKISAHLFAGAEVSKRELTVPSQLIVQVGEEFKTSVGEVDWEEELARAYLYWTPHPWFALGPEYQFERFKRDPRMPGQENITRLDTHRFSLGMNFFHPSGFLAGLKPAFVIQNGRFPQLALSESGSLIISESKGSDRFFVLDASIGYRLPNRWGLITVEVRNLADSKFKFQDTDPANPLIAPDRLVWGRFTLSF